MDLPKPASHAGRFARGVSNMIDPIIIFRAKDTACDTVIWLESPRPAPCQKEDIVSRNCVAVLRRASQIVELLNEARWDARHFQVKHAQIAPAENGGGSAGMEERAASVTLIGQRRGP